MYSGATGTITKSPSDLGLWPRAKLDEAVAYGRQARRQALEKMGQCSKVFGAILNVLDQALNKVFFGRFETGRGDRPLHFLRRHLQHPDAGRYVHPVLIVGGENLGSVDNLSSKS